MLDEIPPHRVHARDRILVIHIMKTAGTSLRVMLQNDLGQSLVYPNDSDLAGLPNRWYPVASEVLARWDTLRPHRVLVGHFPASLLEHMPLPYSGATMLREPVERTISMIDHRIRVSGLNASRLELLDNRNFVNAQVADYQTKVLGMPLGIVNSPAVIDDATEDRAHRMVQTLDFVGLTEHFEESCLLFDSVYSTSISKDVRTVNAATGHAPCSDELLARIRPLVQRDITLYEAARQRFHHDVASNAARRDPPTPPLRHP